MVLSLVRVFRPSPESSTYSIGRSSRRHWLAGAEGGAGLGHLVEDGGVVGATFEGAVAFDDQAVVVLLVCLKQLMKLGETVVGDGWIKMVGNVHVLAVDEDGPSGEGVGEEDPRVG